MLNKILFPAYLASAGIVIMASSIRATEALLPTQVADIAKATVVRIQPTVNSPGTGAIVGRYQENGTNVYVVLTAAHVVQYQDDEYSIVTPALSQNRYGTIIKQRKTIPISYKEDVQKLPGVDLAIVRFRSDRDYQTATVGNSDHTIEGAGVYIAGFPNPSGEKGAIRKRVFQFTSSYISSRLDNEDVDGEEETGTVEDGYALVYTNVTRTGMSGGPVFDVAGRVVGIHGKGDREVVYANESGSELVYGKTGFNLGIPVNTFMKLMPNAIQSFRISLDNSKPGIPLGGGIAIRGEEMPKINISEEEDTNNDDVIIRRSPPLTKPI